MYQDLTLKKWKAFAEQVKQEEITYIFDCPFIQNPITMMMIRDNSSYEEILAYIKKLETIISNLNPVVVYVEKDDFEASFRQVMNERPKEWLDFFTDYYTNQGYGLANYLKGLEGTLAVLKERQKMEKQILNELNVSVYRINNTSLNLSELKNQLTLILKKEETSSHNLK